MSEMTFLYVVIFLLLIVPDMFWKSTKHNKIEIRSIGGIFLFLSAFHTRLAHLPENISYTYQSGTGAPDLSKF